MKTHPNQQQRIPQMGSLLAPPVVGSPFKAVITLLNEYRRIAWALCREHPRRNHALLQKLGALDVRLRARNIGIEDERVYSPHAQWRKQ